jgi:hypothetical protein
VSAPPERREAERQFDHAMWQTFEQSVKAGYQPSYFLRSVKQHGGVETARRLLAKDGLSKGFDALRKVGRLDLSVEAQVLRPHFIDLFTDVERAIARARLAQYGYVTKS